MKENNFVDVIVPQFNIIGIFIFSFKKIITSVPYIIKTKCHH